MTVKQNQSVAKQVGLNITPFPWWAVRKIGIPIFIEADWNYGSIPNGKIGQFVDGTGSIARDTTVAMYGGTGAIKMLTDAVNGDSAEVKVQSMNIVPDGWLLAFEAKWNQTFAFGTSAMHFGIEVRDNANIVHSRFRWRPNDNEWDYQKADTTFASIPAANGGPATVEKPRTNTSAGSNNGWIRSVVDPKNRTYVGFECDGMTGKQAIQTFDMRSMALSLVAQGASTYAELLFFVLVSAGAGGAEPGYTTDWCVSVIPPSLDPFSG